MLKLSDMARLDQIYNISELANFDRIALKRVPYISESGG